MKVQPDPHFARAGLFQHYTQIFGHSGFLRWELLTFQNEIFFKLQKNWAEAPQTDVKTKKSFTIIT